MNATKSYLSITGRNDVVESNVRMVLLPRITIFSRVTRRIVSSPLIVLVIPLRNFVPYIFISQKYHHQFSTNFSVLFIQFIHQFVTLFIKICNTVLHLLYFFFIRIMYAIHVAFAVVIIFFFWMNCQIRIDFVRDDTFSIHLYVEHLRIST